MTSVVSYWRAKTSSLARWLRTKPMVLALYLRYHPDGWADTLQYNTTHLTLKNSLPIQHGALEVTRHLHGDHKVILSTWRSQINAFNIVTTYMHMSLISHSAQAPLSGLVICR